MKYFFLLKQYVLYRLKAKSAHGIHSPFVYDFIETVLKDQRTYYAFEEIASIRNVLLQDTTSINVEDLGAGSLHKSVTKRRVKDIAQHAARNEKFGKLLFRIVEKYQYKNMLELGTSLGIGTSYIASAAKDGQVITIEGCNDIADKATETFASLSHTHIRQRRGNFDLVLTPILQQNPSFDLIIIDGNHREEATLAYFNEIMPFIKDDTLLIFDDIHWSRGMHKAWQTIHSDQRVRLSIDLFFFGLVFFKKDFKEKQHFTLKY